jgi:4a-hydroxytetrahydrobiopterin dehydratase
MNTPLRHELAAKSCTNLPPGSAALTPQQVALLATVLPEWHVINNKAIEREYSCATYMDGVRWFALAAAIAEQEDHHPDALVTWRKVKLTLWTHTVDGLSENDFILAAKLERAWQGFAPAA